MKADSVSLCMVVKNEEQHLEKCLLSAKPLVDEIIVVDTGSMDRTKHLAMEFGAKVYDFEWVNDFSEARNYAISHATASWILILDADEIISPRDYDSFRSIVKKMTPELVAYSLETRNYTFYGNTVGWRANDGKYAEEEAGIGWYPSVKVRLFPNGNHIQFQFSVHEMVDPSLKAAGVEIAKCEIPIHHYGQVNKGKNKDKAELYYEMGVKKLDEMVDDLAAIRELAVQAGNLEKWEESIGLWKRLIAIDSDFAEAYVNIGTAYWHLGKYDNALKYAQKALELTPHLKEGHFNHAISNLFLGNAKEAIAALKNLTEISPDYLAAQFMLGASYCCDERKDEGLPFFEKLHSSSVGAGLAFAFHDLAKRLASAHKIKYAISLLDAAIDSRNVNKDVIALLDECRREELG